MLCCKEAIIICNNYGGAITLDLAIIILREEKDDSQEGKKTKKPKFIMKSSLEFVYTENLVSGKSPLNQESQELLSTVK